ncbi:putative methyltransferase [Abeliophyllum distichum]|uniref:Methyltransferase n=1 Tax=Abeliophyllum distichum TaxID=126358 RepID=A0ABD1V4C2_9LAMI
MMSLSKNPSDMMLEAYNQSADDFRGLNDIPSPRDIVDEFREEPSQPRPPPRRASSSSPPVASSLPVARILASPPVAHQRQYRKKFGLDQKRQRSMASESDVEVTVNENQQPQPKIQIYPTSTGEISSFWREKYERYAKKYCDIFYKCHQDKTWMKMIVR